MSYKETFNPCDECNYSYSKLNEVSSMCKICEFGEYLALDRDGRLIKLPCKPNSIVYVIEVNTDVCWDCEHYESFDDYEDVCHKLDEWWVTQSEEPLCEKQHYHIVEYRYDKEKILYNLDKYGKTWFVDKKDAVKRLRAIRKESIDGRMGD